MSIAGITLLFAVLFPYPFTMAAKWSRQYDNRQVRPYLDSLTGWRQRCYWIHLNSLEILPICGIAVLAAVVAGVPESVLTPVCLFWMGSRVFYAVCYLRDWATLRSVTWTAGYGALLYLIWEAGKLWGSA